MTTADRLLYIYVCQLHKGSFFNYVGQIWPVIDHLPTYLAPVVISEEITKDKSK